MRMEVAQARGAEFGIRAEPVEAMLADPEIEIVLNLTIPRAHVAVGLQAIAAGKHVYGEKPLGIRVSEAQTLVDAAKARRLRIGSAPDTFLGGSHQAARVLLDQGAIGTPVGGTAYFMCPGHESWHPDPGFYYDIGGGPMLDMGPYYITDLVSLLGPVARVAGFSTMPQSERVITSEPKRNQRVPVRVATHVMGSMLFESGAVVQIGMSFDVSGHRHLPLELYGTEGSLIVPDPNFFGGEVQYLRRGEKTWAAMPVDLPYADGNYRSIGLADMAYAIRNDRPHRASGDLALHVLEVMEAFEHAARGNRVVEIVSRVDRPAPIASSLLNNRLSM